VMLNCKLLKTGEKTAVETFNLLSKVLLILADDQQYKQRLDIQLTERGNFPSVSRHLMVN
jgi:ActR/RegA family two-component response regulator